MVSLIIELTFDLFPSLQLPKMVSHSAKVALAVSAGFAAAAAAAGAAYLARAALFRRRLRRAREEWALAGRDVVVLHQFPRPGRSSSAAVALSLSPFPAKLETWLRVVGAKYVNDYTHPTSPETGKSPWVTFNGEEISDSQVIIETLSKKIGMMRELRSIFFTHLTVTLTVIVVWSAITVVATDATSTSTLEVQRSFKTQLFLLF